MWFILNMEDEFESNPQLVQVTTALLTTALLTLLELTCWPQSHLRFGEHGSPTSTPGAS